MTSEIQWEEDWFTVPPNSLDKEQQEKQEEQEQEQQEQQEKEQQEQEQQEQEKEQQEHEQEEQKNTKWQMVERRMDMLQTLVFQQSEMIRVLSQEIKGLKSELHSTTHQSASQNDRTHQLLEELKRVKERELNYALRRHQPVPFFHPNSLLKWDIQLPSPLFRKENRLPVMNL